MMRKFDWEAFWERIACGIDVAHREALPDDSPEADLIRYAIAQQEAPIPRGYVWNIEILI